jgi:hypothetical protein
MARFACSSLSAFSKILYIVHVSMAKDERNVVSTAKRTHLNLAQTPSRRQDSRNSYRGRHRH